jgi:hypothetical protein
VLAQVARVVLELAAHYFRAVGLIGAFVMAILVAGALVDATIYNGRRAGGVWSVPFWYQRGAGWWRLEIQAPGLPIQPGEEAWY